jgi:hypothetical protein
MKKTLFILSLIIFVTGAVSAQKYITKVGTIKFSSDTPMEKIEATNRQVNSALDFGNGNFVFKVLIRGFEFEKALMQEHFNENYMESEKFPNSTFSGKITNIKDVNPSKDGVYKVTAEGDLTMHGVTNKVKVSGNIEIKGNRATGKASFSVAPKDYNIAIPKAVVKNIAESIQVDVVVNLDKAAS